jgi:uncharacterized phage-like protein YoqJ
LFSFVRLHYKYHFFHLCLFVKENNETELFIAFLHFTLPLRLIILFDFVF